MEPHDPVKAPSFSWNAADYSTHSPAQHHWAQELIEKIGLSETDRVLDIGCGDGRVTAAIAERVPWGSVVGIDSSPDMIRFASEHHPSDTQKNLSFSLMDARSLQYHGEFDLVFSNAALHWIPDHRPVLAGIARSLRPGGRLLIQMGGKGNAAQVFSVLADLLKTPLWRGYFEGFSFSYGFYGPDEYRPWLVEAGLEPVRVELIPKDMVYPDREAFGGWIRTTWLPWLTRLPEKNRPAFIKEVIDRFLQADPADPDGTIHVRMMRLEVEARRVR